MEDFKTRLELVFGQVAAQKERLETLRKEVRVVMTVLLVYYY